MKEFTSPRQDKFLVKITNSNNEELNSKVIIAELKVGGPTTSNEPPKKSWVHFTYFISFYFILKTNQLN